ncbi:riboflavin synthase [Amniculibacterium aquaticum]|jgi:riboflavin synthase|uniref:riboflavin synthase n=1 Tax=Amniculibacterium aquaticum TaxID=2479858 RepID=UPI000F5A89FE|nr:riboflavin synthase [Amniculibacterium aquaticum]
MFTGIVEATGIVKNIQKKGKNIDITLTCLFTQELKIDQSLAHNGTCLTVVAIEGDDYVVTAIDETLEKTNLGSWEVGTVVNLERCMKMDGRLDGHIVQGHVDTTGIVQSIENRDGSYFVTVSYHSDFVTVPQGSITLNGISLTVAHSGNSDFSVAIIPYTWENTNMKQLMVGDVVNLEFDIVGKYIAKLLQKQNGF